ncbi:hypothetical protein N7472_005106 [Penicillium cf. griseofulvum]|uniref:Uncharacterized protein n=1 Tax=Penicillium cf. griseofulvum TaxID=2972120 RepID=A0A9W9JQ85_9EURO|nr:hypothetical protein N7472_005106 [Penicillium cf. griseofulvum]
MPERHNDPLLYNSPINATALRQEIIDTIFSSRCAGSPLALAFIFIRPFLTDWDSHNIRWDLSVEAHPGQRHTFIQIDISTYPIGTTQERERNFAFPVYVLKSDAGGRNWEFYRHSTRTTNHSRGLIEELAGLSLM